MAEHITYKKRYKQLKNNTNLRWGNITPTDIDAFIDFGNKTFVVIEYKLEGTEVEFGQRLALERIGENFNKPILIIIADHNTAAEEEIDTGNCLVREFWWNGKWFNSHNRTVRNLIDSFREKYE